MTNVYLAGPFFDDEQISRIERVEQALAANPRVTNFFSPRKSEIPGLTMGTPEWATQTFQMDVSQIDQADVVVGMVDFVDDQVDSGTAFEIGYAFHSKKPVVILHEKDTTLNLMIAEGLHAYVQEAEALAAYDFSTLPESHYHGKVI
ncbi:nucleoside 2-deoxyribosyltransferase [Levilactobacillus parabrevis]|uniref:Nucleoside 2-deoxyribosyltransferase n=1 Tax=Levilactobacillus parabrevis ATCC 53295 TaxID=1267003 RepID=A0A0R1GXR3_9LACO|nr:nucleoside 2-deoxyribosyltransferase [Levilactobacillus parabrevis]KRK39148.1 nucleoside 2-deoxyribosyltransferase [Levilactobacillus parabrevis ATCC 53295]KRO06762.1 nucleoside 2-deoxyribosyltransferase [Levilactobacillus parabrevis]MCT4487993.1 nucleoside 2-deoxyribosyltransferase [Levilactobacillus parabrevis]MCT4489927.1 nucleoside 2-deoxyribosyltransferase [Levilactobacillus parabrevis]